MVVQTVFGVQGFWFVLSVIRFTNKECRNDYKELGGNQLEPPAAQLICTEEGKGFSPIPSSSTQDVNNPSSLKSEKESPHLLSWEGFYLLFLTMIGAATTRTTHVGGKIQMPDDIEAIIYDIKNILFSMSLIEWFLKNGTTVRN